MNAPVSQYSCGLQIGEFIVFLFGKKYVRYLKVFYNLPLMAEKCANKSSLCKKIMLHQELLLIGVKQIVNNCFFYCKYQQYLYKKKVKVHYCC